MRSGIVEEFRTRIDIIDESMLNLFLERMQVSKQIAKYKKAHNLPVFDADREKEVIRKNVENIDNLELKDLYEEFVVKMMELSKKYQERIIKE